MFLNTYLGLLLIKNPNSDLLINFSKNDGTCLHKKILFNTKDILQK